MSEVMKTQENVPPSDQPIGDVGTFDELLTVDEVATLLKVPRSWVYEHARSPGTPRSECLPHIKLGKYLRFDARAVHAFLKNKCRTR